MVVLDALCVLVGVLVGVWNAFSENVKINLYS